MKFARFLLFGCAAVLLATPLHAGIWDDVKAGVQSAKEIVEDVDSTSDEARETVKGAKDVAEETSEDVGSVVPDRAPSQGAPPPPSSRVAAPPPPSATQWQIDIGGGQTRMVGQSELVQMIREGQVDRDTPVWTEALGGWKAAGQVPALGDYFRQ